MESCFNPAVPKGLEIPDILNRPSRWVEALLSILAIRESKVGLSAGLGPIISIASLFVPFMLTAVLSKFRLENARIYYF